MDFNTFVIAGPSTVTTSVLKQAGGSATPGGGTPMALATQCQTDTFSVTGGTGNSPPVICGTNTGYHSKFPSNQTKDFKTHFTDSAIV